MVDFNQALDARLVDDRFARRLAKVRWIHSRIRFGCDTPKQVEDCERAMEMINSYGFKGEYFLYCMLHGTFEECYNRIHHWWERNHEKRSQHVGYGIYPYAQPFRDPHNPRMKIPVWQKYMANWTNKKQLFESIDFHEFIPRKGFQCSQLLDEHKIEYKTMPKTIDKELYDKAVSVPWELMGEYIDQMSDDELVAKARRVQIDKYHREED